jgi:NAD(P)-dependent dehydrogenase (short-subunit alcohol dehydrogenase family)
MSMREPRFNSIALVTGANKGIGFEIARGLGLGGATVLLGCRSEERGREAEGRLRAESIDAVALHLDVTEATAIQEAASEIERQFGVLDILVNNAGVNLEAGAHPSSAEISAIRRIYEVNVFGTIAVTQAMLPLLQRSQRGRIVNLSSSLGSLSGTSDPDQRARRPLLLGYCSSKSAVNAITVQFANELRGTQIKVNSACPGLCATDLSGHRGRSPREGAMTPIRLATLPDDGPTGGFFNDQGQVPW